MTASWPYPIQHVSQVHKGVLAAILSLRPEMIGLLVYHSQWGPKVLSGGLCSVDAPITMS
jgi:hypothetical protein